MSVLHYIMVLSPVIKAPTSSVTTTTASTSTLRLSHFAVSSRRSEPKLPLEQSPRSPWRLHRWPSSPVSLKRYSTPHLPTSPVQVTKQSFNDDAEDNQSDCDAPVTVPMSPTTRSPELSISSIWKRRIKPPKDESFEISGAETLSHQVAVERKSVGGTIDLADSRSALAKIRVHVKSLESFMSNDPIAQALADDFGQEAILSHTSIIEELEEFRQHLEEKVKIFPDYLSTKEKDMIKQVADSVRLGCQIGDTSVSVFKTGPFEGAYLHLSTARAAARGRSASESCVNDEVFVDVPSLAQHGKDGFIARLRLRRLNSGGGIRRNMLWDVAETAQAEGSADRVEEASGGVYAVSRSSGEKLAMFKPAEEEKFVREGIVPGEGAVREEAAYVLDSCSNGYSGVPATAVARLQVSNIGHARRGAVQRYMMGSIGSMEGYGMPFELAKATAFVPVEQVHRIGLLDIRTFNTDRHPGNILLIGDKAPYTMVPIDHGCILPSWFHLSEARFDWLEYPQCKVPLSKPGLAYIESLDAEEDALVLRKLRIREECIVTMKICTLFLKISVKANRTLHWMGSFMQRSGCFEYPSRLELAVQEACNMTGIQFSFVPNEFGEEKPVIQRGILSRRPPSIFFKHLEKILNQAALVDE